MKVRGHCPGEEVMLGVPSAAMQRADLIEQPVTNTDRIEFLISGAIHSRIHDYITIKLDGLIHIPNKRRAREARRLRKAMGLWPWGKKR